MLEHSAVDHILQMKVDDPPLKRLWTSQEVASHLGLSVGWVNNARCTGGGPPFIRIGRLVRYSQAEVERFSRERTRTSTSA